MTSGHLSPFPDDDSEMLASPKDRFPCAHATEQRAVNMEFVGPEIIKSATDRDPAGITDTVPPRIDTGRLPSHQRGVTHFGDGLRADQLGHRMTRDLYAYPNRKPKERLKRDRIGQEWWDSFAWMFRDEEHTEYSDVFLLFQRDNALVNFDISMQYFASLDDAGFNEALGKVLTRGRTFRPVESLKDWAGVQGAYIMVFDDIKQFYIGKADDIRKRVRGHWLGSKPFDRVVFGSKYNSIFPVDELRALDNTRLYAARSTKPFAVEQRTEKAADQRYCLNRMHGGEPHAFALLLDGIRQRTHDATVVPSTAEAVNQAKKEVTRMIEQSSGGPLVTRLAGLDLSVHAFERPTGTRGAWSRRDAIGSAAIRGKLNVQDYARFLEAIGEKVLWPED